MQNSAFPKTFRVIMQYSVRAAIAVGIDSMKIIGKTRNSNHKTISMKIFSNNIKGDQLYMAVYIWYLAESDLYSVH